jgi:hypothetical protein
MAVGGAVEGELHFGVLPRAGPIGLGEEGGGEGGGDGESKEGFHRCGVLEGVDERP